LTGSGRVHRTSNPGAFGARDIFQAQGFAVNGFAR
jgi:hypothetical protein